MRVNRTVRDFETALEHLLQQAPFDKLTVDQICQEALLHRSSFYRYFHDKYDLLKQLIQSQLNHLVATAAPHEDLIAIFIHYVGAHRVMFQNLAAANARGSFNMELFKIVSEILLDPQLGREEDVVRQAMQSSSNPRLLAYILSGATMGAFEWWREENYDVPTAEIVAVVKQVLSGTAREQQKGRQHVGDD